ncbi:hypothetical protein [Streptomyces varsoviensis]|uniref:hypothetical protein n=1 Tax=Streptomyces varsoviensis TaxID=67373 RepID=UPI0009984F7B|nr:hypothetical protein [Streptomyces varsoviensis]
MSTDESSRFVRLRVELVLEINDSDKLTAAALDRLDGDGALRGDEREHARTSVSTDTAEALAYLVDPIDAVREVPGVELTQASWSSEQIDYDPDAREWALDGDYEDDEVAREDEED